MTKNDSLIEMITFFEKRSQTLPPDAFTDAERALWENKDPLGNPIREGLPPPPEAPYGREGRSLPKDEAPYGREGKSLSKEAPPAADPKVLQMQTALKYMGLKGADGKDLVLDGKSGKNTQFALKSFKQEYNMPEATDALAMHYLLHPDQNPNKKRYAESTATLKYNRLFEKVALFERLSLYGERATFLERLAQDASFPQETVEQWDPSQKKDLLGRPMREGVPPVPQAPVPVPAGPPSSLAPTAPAALPAIPANIQGMLSQMLSERGEYVPLIIDGKLGPQTQKALDIFKQKYNSAGLSGQALFNEVEKAFNIWQANQKVPGV